ncbi:hypothetical protein ACFL35_15740 [Candidatus Riflebacteria bacterium]
MNSKRLLCLLILLCQSFFLFSFTQQQKNELLQHGFSSLQIDNLSEVEVRALRELLWPASKNIHRRTKSGEVANSYRASRPANESRDLLEDLLLSYEPGTKKDFKTVAKPRSQSVVIGKSPVKEAGIKTGVMPFSGKIRKDDSGQDKFFSLLKKEVLARILISGHKVRNLGASVHNIKKSDSFFDPVIFRGRRAQQIRALTKICSENNLDALVYFKVHSFSLSGNKSKPFFAFWSGKGPGAIKINFEFFVFQQSKRKIVRISRIRRKFSDSQNQGREKLIDLAISDIAKEIVHSFPEL